MFVRCLNYELISVFISLEKEKKKLVSGSTMESIIVRFSPKSVRHSLNQLRFVSICFLLICVFICVTDFGGFSI